MISESQQEQAALYALGLLDDAEAGAFQRAMDADPELHLLARELREAAASLAVAAGSGTVAPPPGLKPRLLADVSRTGSGQPVPPGRIVRGPWTTWIPWTIAAAAVLSAIVSGVGRNQEYLRAARFQGQYLRALAARNQEKPIMQVAAYQLEPTPDSPVQPRATVVWDPKRREGELIVTQLNPPRQGHDYQLWAVEEGRKDAVSAGLVHVDGEGRARVEFKPTDGGDKKVQAFALSLEQAGGSEKNQGPILLLGKL